MVILLTGATGLIGRALIPECLRRGYRVRALVRDVERARASLGRDVELFPWTDGADVPPAAVRGIDGLVHLAGENIAAQRWSSARKKALRDSRVQTADALARAMSAPIDFVISASGIGFYGDCGDEELTEAAPPGTDFLARLCLEWETASQRIPARRHVQTRFGVVLAANGGFLEQVTPLFKRLGASPLGSGQQFMSWIHIDDAVAVLMAAIERPSFTGAYNATAPVPLRNRELTRELAERLGVWNAPAVPGFALKLMYGELATALLSSQRALPSRLLVERIKFKYPDFKAALDPFFSRR